MEKNSNKTGVCEKIFRAITVSPSFRTLRRIAHFPQDPASTSPDKLDSTSYVSAAGKIIDIQSIPPQPKSAEAKVIKVQITSGNLPLPAAASTPRMDAQKPNNVTKAEMLAQPQKDEEKQKLKYMDSPPVPAKNEGKKADINDIFSAYIDRTKMKIGTMSSNEICESDDGNHDVNKREGGRDHFSDFIHTAKNKFKSTPSSIDNGKIASFKRE